MDAVIEDSLRRKFGYACAFSPLFADASFE